jgi:hypothetical protein
MKHNYHERKTNRIAYAKEQVEKNEQKATALHKRANYIANITQGEPIKIGHHSEARHRKDLERMDNAMRGAVDASKKADYYDDKAAAIVDNRAISSDDPQVLQKLRDQLEQLIKKQTFMKQVNRLIRTGNKDAFLALPGISEKHWVNLNEDGRHGGKGFASYELTNNNANISRIKKRVTALEREERRPASDQVIKGIRLVENKEANRIQLIFPQEPSDKIKEVLKRQFAFKYSKLEGAWQRFLNNAGRYAAKSFLETYDPEG